MKEITSYFYAKRNNSVERKRMEIGEKFGKNALEYERENEI